MAPTNFNENHHHHHHQQQELGQRPVSQRSVQRVQTSGDRVVSPLGMSPKPDIEVVFVHELPEKYQCPVCSQALRSPMRLLCGDLLCATCLLNLTAATCPKCGAELDKKEAVRDNEIHRKIQLLEVRCTFYDNGCGWSGTLRELQGHAYQCQYIDVPCPRGCGQLLPKNKLEKHLNSECDKRALPCEFCHQDVAIKGMDSHLKVCRSVLVDCPNGCGTEELTRAQLKLHMPTCPKAGSSCPFVELGCDYTGGRETLQQHIRTEPIKHLTLLCDAVLDLKSETLEKLYGAQLIWRIDNVRQKQNEARSGTRTMIFSEPFMSGRHGYKMMASIALYGDGQARGQYVSAFVCVMRGDYDALLEWPFAQRVTITVMDQHPNLEDRNDVSYVFKPNPLPAYKAYLDRPISERNASFGAARFCEIDIIEKYIYDDVLFIKVNVESNTGIGF